MSLLSRLGTEPSAPTAPKSVSLLDLLDGNTASEQTARSSRFMGDHRDLHDALKAGDLTRSLELLELGNFSSWSTYNLLDSILVKRSVKLLRKYIEKGVDLREADLVKAVLFCLTCYEDDSAVVEKREECLELVALIVKVPFRRTFLIGYLKNFGSKQVLALLEILCSFLETTVISSSVLRWISACVDAHYALLVVQPVFLEALHRLHRQVSHSLALQQELEAVLPRIRPAKVPEPCDATPTSPLYWVETKIDL